MRKYLRTKLSYAFYTLCVSFSMVGCADQKVKTIVVKQVSDELSIVKIDTCEYILFDGYYAGGLIHKENCKNH